MNVDKYNRGKELSCTTFYKFKGTSLKYEFKKIDDYVIALGKIRGSNTIIQRYKSSGVRKLIFPLWWSAILIIERKREVW